MKIKLLKSEKGITLIALIVTIVVLLILAGVTISMITGENGMLNQANNAKKETEKAGVQEQRDLARTEARLNQGKTEYKETIDEEEVTVIIPEGFARTKIEGESNIEDGMVIIDAEGNEYVWIPCTVTEYENATDQKSTWNSAGYNDKAWNDETVEGTIDYEDRLASITTYGGFYVARYEAGVPEDAPFYANTDGATYNKSRNVTTYTPVSKKGVQAWNWISQTKAKEVAQKMVSNNTAQSYLIDSYAWDIVCKKIDSKYGINKNIKNSTTWGNYYNNTTTNYEGINTLFAVHKVEGSWKYATKYQKVIVSGAPKNSGYNRLELSTGASEDFKAYNLYDVAGNMWEWTTEISGNDYAVHRGGSFNDSGSGIPAVHRSGNHGSGNTFINIGFRSVLYIK